MAFYLMFPGIAVLMRGLRSSVAFFVVSLAFSNVAFDVLWEHRSFLWPEAGDASVSTFLTFGILFQLPVFASGVVLYFLVDRFKGVLPIGWVRIIGVAALSMAIFLIFHPHAFNRVWLNVYIMYGLCFTVIAFCLSDGVFSLAVNKVVCYIGSISYSMYLVHFLVLSEVHKFLDSFGFLDGGVSIAYPLVFVLTVLISVFLATLTFRLIEQPMILLGRRFVEYRKCARA